MPTVPVYERQVSPGQPRVREAGLNPPRMVSPPVEAFGAADAKTMQALGQTINAVGMTGLNLATDEIRRENKIAEDTRFFGLSTRISEKALELQNHALQQKGRNAFGVHEVIDKEWSKLQDEVLKESGYSDTLKARVMEDLTKQRLGLKKQYEVHVANEAQELQINDLKARLAISKEKAAASAFDDDAIKGELGELDNVLSTYANTYGLSSEDEAYKLTKLEHISGLHKKVIETRLGANNSLSAKDYFDKNRKAMTQDDAKEMEGDLKNSLIRYKADTLSQEAASKYGSVNQALKYFDTIKDLTPEEKEKAISLTRMRFDIKEEAKKKAEEYNYNVVSKAIENAARMKNAGDPGAVAEMANIQNSPEWKALSAKHHTALFAQYNDEDILGNPDIFLRFIGTSSGVVARMPYDKFQTEVYQHLNEKQKSTALSYWQNSRTADDKNKFITPFSKYKDDFNAVLNQAGFPTEGKAFTDSKKEEYSKMMLAIQDKIENFEVNKLGGKSASDAEIRQILKDEIKQRYIKRSFLGADTFYPDSAKIPLSMTSEERVQSYIPIEDVPIDLRSVIQKEAAQNGKTLSDYEIGKAYSAYVDRRGADYDTIVGRTSPSRNTNTLQPSGNEFRFLR